MTPNGIRIYKYDAIYTYPEFRITPNTHLIYSPTLKGNMSHTLSIEDMKNSVKVITETDKMYTVKAVAKDADSIYKYGVLQDIFKIDEKDGDANTYAKNKLAELNKIKESFSIEIIGQAIWLAFCNVADAQIADKCCVELWQRQISRSICISHEEICKKPLYDK